MTFKAKLILFLVIIISINLSSADEKANSTQFSAYPHISYSNNTGFIFGGLGLIRYYPKNISDPQLRNLHKLYIAFTEKKQFEIELEQEFNLHDGKTRIISRFAYKDWPSEFYGIGKNYYTDPDNYTLTKFSIYSEFNRKITDTFYLGLIADLDNTNILEIEENCSLQQCNIPGNEKYSILGLGFTFSFDRRNSTVFPTKGNFQQFKFVHFESSLGSDFDFTKSYLDLRYYTSISESHIFAFQTLLEHTLNTAPFLELAKLGDEIRAFGSARFIDNNLIVSRMEYRQFPFKTEFMKRLGFVLFAEAGQVSNSIKEFEFKEIKFCYGTGFRFSIFPDERINLRIDLGIYKNETGISIELGEAF